MSIEVPKTCLSPDKMQVLINSTIAVNNLQGNMAEVGVYLGGSAYYINKNSNGRRVYLFDTFEGIPMSGNYDRHAIGDFSDTSFEAVSEIFLSDSNVELVKGVFPESAKGVIKDDDKFCFVHLDADQYESTKNGLYFFYDKMVKGGIILMDDYGWLPGVYLAITEFFNGKPEALVQEAYFQCYIVKQ